jgi:hypothetical protein
MSRPTPVGGHVFPRKEPGVLVRDANGSAFADPRIAMWLSGCEGQLHIFARSKSGSPE